MSGREGVGSMRKPANKGEGVKNWQNLADVFYGRPLIIFAIKQFLIVIRLQNMYYSYINNYVKYIMSNNKDSRNRNTNRHSA